MQHAITAVIALAVFFVTNFAFGEMSEEEYYALFSNLDKPDLIFTREQKQAMKSRSVYSNVTKWANGVVPYVFTDSVNASRLHQKVLTKVFAEYAKQTCIRLVPRTTEANYIQFVDTGGCASHFGMIGGRQDITLDEGCVRYNYGTAMHEIMHSLGFMHEQMRPDRDYFVNILWQNIPPGAKDQFVTVPYKDTDFVNSYYDFNSLMHYPRNAFTGDFKVNSVEPKDKKYLSVIGQREYFSDCDIAKINRLYKCGGNYKTTC